MASKPTGRPNLALAGKREAQAPLSNNSNRGAKRGRGRGRGGRTDNTRGGFNKKPELIQTGGVFSEGLGGDFPSRKKERDPDLQQFSWRKQGEKSEAPREKSEKAEKDPKDKIQSDGKTSFRGWEELWASDEEEDEKHLKSVLPRGFITDLKKGTMMPFVLPTEDRYQFKNVLRKNPTSEDTDEEEEKEEKKYNEANASKIAQPTPEELISILEASTSDLLHLQLPSILGTICHNSFQQETPMEVDNPEDGEEPQAPSPSNDILPKSTRIGKLQVTRKGRLLLQIGGYTVDVTNKPTAGKQQGVILLQTDPAGQQIISQATNQPQFISPNNVENEITYIGNVKHNLVGSVTWEQLNEEKNEKEKMNGSIRMNGNPVLDATEVRHVKELEEVQKGWQDLAESWAKGNIP